MAEEVEEGRWKPGKEAFGASRLMIEAGEGLDESEERCDLC